MTFEFTPYILPLYFITLLLIGQLLYLWSRRSTAESLPLLALLAGTALWTGSYSLELLGVDLSTKLIWGRVAYLGIVMLPMAWLHYALRYSGSPAYNNFPLGLKGFLFVVPISILIIVWTPSLEHLIWESYTLQRVGPFLVVDYNHGVASTLLVVYSYPLFLYGGYLLVKSALASSHQRRLQVTAFLIAVLIPWIGNGLYVFDILPLPGIDFSPFAFAISGLALSWVMLSYKLTGLVPIARNTVIENIQSGVIVLDKFRQIEFTNTEALAILGRTGETLKGKTLPYLCPDWSRLEGIMREECYEPISDVFSCQHSGTQEYYEISLSPLTDRFDTVIGHLLLFQNITTRFQERAELRKLRQAVETSGEAIYMTDTRGVFTYVNPQFTELYGFQPEEVINRLTPDILESERQTSEKQSQFWETLPRQEAFTVSSVNRTKSGRLIHVEGSINPIFDDQGKGLGYLAIQRDVTEEYHAKRDLEDRIKELTFLNRLAEAGVKTVDEDQLIKSATQLVGEIFSPDYFGILLLDDAGEVLQLHSSYQLAGSRDDIEIPLGEGITGKVAQRGEAWYVPDVSREPAHISAGLNTRSELCVPLNSGEEVIGVINMESKFTEAYKNADLKLLTTFADQLAIAIQRSRLFEQVQKLAVTDELTGLTNRRHFFKLAQAEFDRAMRYGHPVSVIMMDVDQFKEVNDSYGHAVGDTVLRGIAARLMDNCRKVDILARYGGEEFVMMLPETSLASASEAAERTRLYVSQTALDSEVGEIDVTISLGVAEISSPPADLQSLLNRADQALLRAKGDGRNCVRSSAVLQH